MEKELNLEYDTENCTINNGVLCFLRLKVSEEIFFTTF